MKNRARTLYLDVARTIAIIAVSLNHAVNRTYENYSGTAAEFRLISRSSTMLKTCVTTFSKLGVPLFLMLTGGLLLNKTLEDPGQLRPVLPAQSGTAAFDQRDLVFYHVLVHGPVESQCGLYAAAGRPGRRGACLRKEHAVPGPDHHGLHVVYSHDSVHICRAPRSRSGGAPAAAQRSVAADGRCISQRNGASHRQQHPHGDGRRAGAAGLRCRLPISAPYTCCMC